MGQTLTPFQLRSIARLRAHAAFASIDDEAFAHCGRWRNRLGMAADTRLVVEIGCADGGLLARAAAKHSTTAFVGVDWTFGDVADAADRVTADGLQNVAMVRGRAQELRQLFGVGEVDEFWVFHPEPIPDRLFAEAFLLDARSVLRDASSRVTLKTDHAGYFQSTLALLDLPQPDWANNVPRAPRRDLLPTESLPSASEVVRRAFDVAAVSLDFWNDPAAQMRTADRAFAGERTAYEARFVAKRRPIFFVDLRPRYDRTWNR